MATEEAVMAVIKASRPNFRNPFDKVAFALHASFLASGYALLATGNSAFSDTIYSSPPSDEVGIEGWNEKEDGYGFVYSKIEKGVKKTVLVKCLIMGDYLVIDALCSTHEDREISVQINVNDYTEENSGSSNFADKYKDFGKLVKTLNSDILSRMEDSLKKDAGASPSGSQVDHPAPSTRPEQNKREPQGPEPDRAGFVVPPVLPGHFDDSMPGPGAGVYPRVGPVGGGSMLVGPNDPRWFGAPQPGFPAGSGVPPGARYDPYGPPGLPGFEPNRFGRNPQRPGLHPDLQPFGSPDDFPQRRPGGHPDLNPFGNRDDFI
ncbi:hypothetical protein ACHQM5_021835 [Ranunculus cassubicifolius]